MTDEEFAGTFIGILTAAAGIAVSVGWEHNIEILKSGLHGAVTMKYSTAISFILAGFLLVFLLTRNSSELSKSLLAVPAILLLALQGFVFIGMLTGTALPEWLAMGNGDSQVHTPVPGLPSALTSAGFLLVGLVGVLGLSNSDLRFPARMVSVTLTLLGLVALIGHLLHIPWLFYASDINTGMAFHTAFLFVLVGAAIGTCDSSRASSELR